MNTKTVEHIINTGKLPMHLQQYRRLRAKGWYAAQALSAARTLAEWNKHVCLDDDPPRATWRDCGPLVRLRVANDPDYRVDGDDMYDPQANPGIAPHVLERQRKAEIERVEQEGACGIIGEYWTGEGWEHADSVWGFVGNDWVDSGYDHDIKRATLDEAMEHYAKCFPDYEGMAAEVD